MQTGLGVVTIGEQELPVIFGEGKEKRHALTFQSNAGSSQAFADCKFTDPRGVYIRFQDGGIVLGGPGP